MKQYTIAQAAEKFGVKVGTLRQWIKRGKIEVTRLGPMATVITEEQFNARTVGRTGYHGWSEESLEKWNGICTRS